jgi:hypothetical protein
MGNTSRPQTSRAVFKKEVQRMSHIPIPGSVRHNYPVDTQTRLFQLGSCQTQDTIRNDCIMDEKILQGDKIVKIAGGFTHLVILTCMLSIFN